MSNKAFWVLLIGGLVSIIALIMSIINLIPSFLTTIVLGIYGITILYISR